MAVRCRPCRSTRSKASPRQSLPTRVIAPTATLIGDVTIESGASVWYGVVILVDGPPGDFVRPSWRGCVQDSSLFARTARHAD